MAFRRFLFIYDASDPVFWVQRYLATDHPHNEVEPIDWSSTPDGRAASGELRSLMRDRFEIEHEAWATRRDEIAAARRRVASVDIFAPSEWAVVDADVLLADDNLTHVPGQVTAFLAAPHQRVDQFMHFCDRELAAGFLREAMKHSLDDIQQMANVREQAQAVLDMWRNFANYWRALNVRPWGWSMYRCMWEVLVGTYRGTIKPTVGMNHTLQLCVGDGFSFATGAYPSSAPGLTEVFWRRPTALDLQPQSDSWVFERQYTATGGMGYWRRQWQLEGYWRTGGAIAMNHMFRNDFEPQDGPYELRLGQWEAIRNAVKEMASDSDSSCSNDERRERICPYPTGEAHRLWITNFATLTGTFHYPDQLDTDGPFDGAEGRDWDDLTNPGHVFAHNKPNDWNTYAGKWYSSFTVATNQAETPRYAFLPPLNWYAQLLWPLMRYLASRDPLEVVYEVRLDVLGKNLWTSVATGQSEQLLSQLGEQRTIRSAQEMRAEATSGVGWTVMSAATVAAAFIPAVGPLVSGVLGLVTSIAQIGLGSGSEYGNRFFDCFGRLEPALEAHQIVGFSRATDAEKARKALFPRDASGTPQPAPPPGFVDTPLPPLYAQSSQGAVAREAASVAIVPPGLRPIPAVMTPHRHDPAKLAAALVLGTAAAGGAYYVSRSARRRGT